MYTLILLELKTFLKKYSTNSEINQLLATYLEYKIMNLLCVDSICIAFIEYMLAGKTWLDYTDLFSRDYYKKMTK